MRGREEEGKRVRGREEEKEEGRERGEESKEHLYITNPIKMIYDYYSHKFIKHGYAYCGSCIHTWHIVVGSG